jgi:hypothetical protein
MKVVVKCRSTNKELVAGTLIGASNSYITVKVENATITTFLLRDVILSF